MTAPQIKFAQGVAMGLNQTEAYKVAYPKSGEAAARRSASALMTNPDVSAYVEQLRAEVRKGAVITVQERMAFLSSAITTPLAEVNESSPLCAEQTVDEVGEMTVRTRIKKVDPLRALDLLNKMDGAYQPAKVEIDRSDSLRELLKNL